MSSTHSPLGRYAVLVPVKTPSVGKSRLRDLGDPLRSELAIAFARDTVLAALECSMVARVLVVTDDHLAAADLAGLGADVLPDGAGDLNASLVQAAAEMHRRDATLHFAALCADLPALRPHDLADALEAADQESMSFVADTEGVGTTTVLAPRLEDFQPGFGPGSRQRHLDAGAHEIGGALTTLRRDVDDPADLEDALRLGVGPATAAVSAHRHDLIDR